jgi:chemotaxis signal transduction protein
MNTHATLRAARTPRRTERIIVFSVGSDTFAIAAAAVQEIRSTDSLSGGAMEIQDAGVPKVRNFIRRGRRTYYVVSAAKHFGLPSSPPTLIFLLRHSHTAVLADSIERMTELSRLVALPYAFQGEERSWYRGLALLEGRVVPVVNPSGFLRADELAALDAAAAAATAAAQTQGVAAE